ncbi:MAG: V-type ATP synthase subunit F [candidate division WOR-3 bacterium]
MRTNRSKVAVIGREEVILPLRGAGLDVFPVVEGTDVRQQTEAVIRSGYQVIFYTDDLSPELQPLLERYSRETLPCLVALPFTGRKVEFDPLREAVRRAAGADLLGSKPERFTGPTGGGDE